MYCLPTMMVFQELPQTLVLGGLCVATEGDVSTDFKMARELGPAISRVDEYRNVLVCPTCLRVSLKGFQAQGLCAIKVQLGTELQNEEAFGGLTSWNFLGFIQVSSDLNLVPKQPFSN